MSAGQTLLISLENEEMAIWKSTQMTIAAYWEQSHGPCVLEHANFTGERGRL